MTRSADRKISPLALALWIGFFSLPGQAQEILSPEDFQIELSGYLQELGMHSDDFFGQSLDLSQTRVRLTFDFDFSRGVSGEFSQTLQGESGSAFFNPVFQLSREIETPTYFDWDSEVEDQDDHRLDWSVYRAWLKYENEKLSLTAGRQRIALGTAYFFSPMDIFNPVSPLALESEERVGVDGAGLELALNENTYLTFAYGIGDVIGESKFAADFKTTIQSYDLSLLSARLLEDWVIAAGFSGYLKNGSLYGEAAYTFPEAGDQFLRTIVGYQYSWKNSIILTAEYFYNEGIFTEEMLTNPALLAANQDPLVTIGKNFLCLSIGFDLNPLLRFNAAAIYELDHGSFFVGPGLSYSASNNLTLAAGAQMLNGSDQGDFGIMPGLVWAKVRWDF